MEESFDVCFSKSNFLFAVEGPIEVYFKIPVSEISKIDDQRSVSPRNTNQK